LPVILKRLEKSKQVRKTTEGLYQASLAGKAAEIPERLLHPYFRNLFRISDTSKVSGSSRFKTDTEGFDLPCSGHIERGNFHTLLKMSGFCLTSTQLKEIAAAVTISAGGTIHYEGFIPQLVAVVHKKKGGGAGAPREGEAGAGDWAAFEAALESLSIV